ncbi:MAG TPA: nucleotide exchange factor GrpE [Thermoleophilia bacterium]
MTDRKHTKDDGKRRSARPKAAPEVSAAEGVAAVDTAAVDGELAKLASDCDAYLDHLRRLQAEFDNYRKRVQRDAEVHRLRAAEAVVESLLPVMDNMARALDAAARHEEGQLIAGLELVAGQLHATLEGHGLDEVPVEAGTLFDPNVHEAVLTQPSDDYEEGAVLQVLERGYLLHGRLLRPAKVIVAS